jgi:hypothetical protein
MAETHKEVEWRHVAFSYVRFRRKDLATRGLNLETTEINLMWGLPAIEVLKRDLEKWQTLAMRATY